MKQSHKQWLAWGILSFVTLAISLFFGIQYPMPEQPPEPPEPVALAANFTNPVDIEGSSSASAPALTFEDDTDTGLFRSAADTINVATGGSERLELDSSAFTVVPSLEASGGLVNSGGKLDVNDAIDCDGSSDEVQLAVTGYTTQTSDLVFFDGGLTDIGGATYTTADGDNDLGVAGDVEIDGELELDGALDADSTANIAGATTFGSTIDVSGGDITLENDETLSNSSNGIVTTNGEWGYLQYFVDKSSAYTATTAESGAMFTNDGASAAFTITLPAASEGLVYGFLAQDDYDLYLDPNGSEQILSCTDTGGDRCNLDTQYDFTWLVSDGTGWLPFGTVGTLADAN